MELPEPSAITKTLCNHIALSGVSNSAEAMSSWEGQDNTLDETLLFDAVDVSFYVQQHSI